VFLVIAKLVACLAMAEESRQAKPVEHCGSAHCMAELCLLPTTLGRSDGGLRTLNSFWIFRCSIIVSLHTQTWGSAGAFIAR
jgi:hypothetical protein